MTKKKDAAMRMKKDKEVIAKLQNLGKEVSSAIKKEKSPSISIPIRTLSNIEFDEKHMKLRLGSSISRRSFMNVAHARKFMQTMLIASWICNELVKEGITTSLRDMYYAIKRTIPGTKENTVEEQSESDPIVVDLETALDVLREELHLNADVRGRVVGNVVIKDRGDTVDWSKLGSGGWSIPSNVENIEFKEVDADYILLIEKNAAFERLHEDKFWKTHNCILMTSQGQAARGVRRLANRLSTEAKIPLIIFSVDAGEPIITIDDDGWVRNRCIGEYVDSHMEKYGKIDVGAYERSSGCSEKAVEIGSEGNAKIGNIVNVVRHPIYEDLKEVITEPGFSVRVTNSHSVMVFENYEIIPKKVSELKKGDLLVSPVEVPNNESVTEVDWLDLIRKDDPSLLQQISETNNYIHEKGADIKIPRKVKVGEKLCRLLGYYAAKGHIEEGEVCLSFSAHEKECIEDALQCINEVFGCEAHCCSHHPTEVQIRFGGKLISVLFRNGHVPDLIFNVPNVFKKEFLRGYFRGNGRVYVKEESCYLCAETMSRKLAADILLLILQVGGWAQIEDSENYQVVISNKQTLQMLSEIVKDLDKNALSYLKVMEADKSSLHKSIPSEVLKPLQNEIKMVTGKDIGFIVNKQKHIPLKTLQELFRDVSSLEPKLKTLKNLADNGIALLPVKSIKAVSPTNGFVYDIEVNPTHTFVGGMGPLLLHNTDGDAYGWYIYSVIKWGSMNLAHVSEKLGTPNAKFLGLTMTDIETYGLEKYTIKAKDIDIKRAKELLNYPWFQRSEWQKEIKLMIKKGYKAELEALSSKGLRFITNTYLPEKIENKMFLP